VSGRLVAERFRLRELLGSGGTAAVYRAHDTVRGEDVALKLLHPHLAADAPMRDAFFEEVRAAQSAAHPSLVEIYDAGVAELDPPVAWIALEYVSGITLEDYVRENGALDPSVVQPLAEALLQALAALHAVGVVHRDVSPQNVMFDPAALADPERFGRSVRLLDFGLADVSGRSTRGTDALLSGSGEPIGVVATVAYASPEQLLGAPVGESSDVYQAGATLFLALTGTPPFPGASAAVVRAHLAAPPPVPSARRRGVPRAWDRLITTAMLKDPADRYEGAEAMRAVVAARLEPRMADGRAGVAQVPTALTRPYRTTLPSTSTPIPSHGAPGAGEGLLRPARHWPGWLAGGIGAAAIAAIVVLSSMAGAAPSAVPHAAPPAVSTPAPSQTVSVPPTTAPEIRTVPELGGRTLADARAALQEAGLATGTISIENAPVAADTVLGSDPPAGHARPSGAAIALRVASGANTVPQILGLTPSDASAALAAAGFSFALLEEGEAPQQVVSASSPAPGQAAGVGSVVTVTVPHPLRATPSPTPSPTASPSPTPAPVPSASPTG
jgi:serine/threonine-protein kinase